MVKVFAFPLLLLVAAPVSGGGVLGGDAPACAAGDGPAVLAQITGLKDRKGELELELYPANERDFLDEGKRFRRVQAAIPAAGPVALCMRVPRPGRYAMVFTHNRDGKGKFSIWSDGAGFAGSQKLGRSKPKLNQAIVDVPAGVTRVPMRAQYLRGLSGFAPMKES